MPTPSTEQSDPVWQHYVATRDADARRQLLDRYLGLVHHVARQIAARAPALELDDLISAGSIGLVKALESFDLGRGLAFSTYAVQRIRGAVLDDLRSRDWVPRSVRGKGRQLSGAVQALEHQLGRSPESREVASALGIDAQTYHDWQTAVDSGVMMSIDRAATSDEHGEAPSVAETLADGDALLPGDALVRAEQVESLRVAISRLPERERTVLALYYYEELTLKQIADVLHLTESRISQIRSQSLRRLRTLMADVCDTVAA